MQQTLRGSLNTAAMLHVFGWFSCDMQFEVAPPRQATYNDAHVPTLPTGGPACSRLPTYLDGHLPIQPTHRGSSMFSSAYLPRWTHAHPPNPPGVEHVALEQHVCRLDVAVHQLHAVQVLDGQGHLKQRQVQRLWCDRACPSRCDMLGAGWPRCGMIGAGWPRDGQSRPFKAMLQCGRKCDKASVTKCGGV